MLNFYGTNVNLCSLIFFWCASSVVFFTNNTYVSWSDFYTRTCVGDFFINLYYYFWTSAWYIPALLYIIWLFGLCCTYYPTPNVFTMLFLPLYMVVFLLHDYWGFNPIPYNLELNPAQLNLLLVNSINKYHPLIFYYVFMCAPITYSSLSVYFVSPCHTTFMSSAVGYARFLDPLSQVLSVTLTLYLGSWWALQEGSWGGWWNWDPSEVFGLVVMVVLVGRLHAHRGANSNYVSVMGLLVVSLVIQWLYVFTQLNFNLISHNFGINVPGPVNTSQFFMVICVSILLIGIKAARLTSGKFFSYLSTYSVSGTFAGSGGSLFEYVLLYALLGLPAALSFSPLLSDFASSIFDLNVLNYLPSVEDYTHLVFVTGVLGFYSLESYLLLLLTYGILVSVCWGVLILPYISSFFRLKRLHLYLLLVLITSATLSYTVSVVGLFTSAPATLRGFSGELVYSPFLGSFMHTVVGLGYTWFGAGTSDLLSTAYSFFAQNTSLEVGLFTLVGQGAANTQGLNLATFSNLFNVNVVDPSTGALLITLISILHGLLLFARRKLIIIF